MIDSAAAPPIYTCPNCSTSLLGGHCHECGQKKIEANEYSLKRFIGRAINIHVCIDTIASKLWSNLHDFVPAFEL